MAKVWSETIEAHRRDVRGAILDATAAFVAARGLLSVTMSQVAEATGIGRATLYNYFPDVEAILLAWHERHVSAHLEHLARVRDSAGSPAERVEAVLQAYASIAHAARQHGGSELAAFVHRGTRLARAEDELHALLRDLLAEAATAGVVRGDVAAAELAIYCQHALDAARSLSSEAAVRRLVTVTMGGLRGGT